MAKIMTANTVEAIHPAGSPTRYQPTCCPTKPANAEPPMPSRVVMMKPKFSLPGCRNFANTPITNPIMMVLIQPISLVSLCVVRNVCVKMQYTGLFCPAVPSLQFIALSRMGRADGGIIVD